MSNAMSYDPKVPGEFERSRAYNLQWLGLPAALLWLGFEILLASGLVGDAARDFVYLPAIFAAGSLVWPLGSLSDSDEFIQRQHLVAASWGMAMSGLIAFVYVFPSLHRFLPEIDATLSFAVVAVTFNAALVTARLRAG
ncbi:MAG: hypothetical protein AAGA34_14975 [Pseudomonadota bacterium]